MTKSQLQIGLVIHWQNGGWHGLNQIHSWTDRTITYSDPEYNSHEIHKTNLNRWLKNHIIATPSNDICHYYQNHKYLHCVGKCFPINQLPTKLVK